MKRPRVIFTCNIDTKIFKAKFYEKALEHDVTLIIYNQLGKHTIEIQSYLIIKATIESHNLSEVICCIDGRNDWIIIGQIKKELCIDDSGRSNIAIHCIPVKYGVIHFPKISLKLVDSNKELTTKIVGYEQTITVIPKSVIHGAIEFIY